MSSNSFTGAESRAAIN